VRRARGAGFFRDHLLRGQVWRIEPFGLQRHHLRIDPVAIEGNVAVRVRCPEAGPHRRGYGLFFASAGHAALYDYPTATGLQAVAADIWARGGIVGTMCHGPAILPGTIDAKTGQSPVACKTVTGFTLEGEMLL
jgi:hypothetical protein